MLKTSRILLSGTENIQQYLQKSMQILDPEGQYSLPNVKVINRTGVGYLGRCLTESLWTSAPCKVKGYHSTIELQKSITTDDQTLFRIIAHECCHHTTYYQIGLDVSLEDFRLQSSQEGSHGPIFLQQAAKINAVLGADFVTVTSDEAMVISSDKEFYVFLQYDGSSFSWSWSARISPQQWRFIQTKLLGHPGKYKLTKSRDTSLDRPGNRIGTAWLIWPAAEGQAKLRDLWENAPDESGKLQSTLPPFTVIMKKDATGLQAWFTDKITPSQKQDIEFWGPRTRNCEVRAVRCAEPKIKEGLPPFHTMRGIANMTVAPGLLTVLWNDAKTLVAFTAG